MKFIPITTDEKRMTPYLTNAFCKEVFYVFQNYYPKIGFQLPWVGYFAILNGEVLGTGGFKGAPKNNTVEIAYGVVPEKEGKGYATQICRRLTQMALEHDNSLRVTARTLMEENASTSILKKCNYTFVGVVDDPEDGQVWEWELSRKDFNEPYTAKI